MMSILLDKSTIAMPHAQWDRQHDYNPFAGYLPTVHMSDFGSWYREQLRILVLINRVIARIWISCQLQELSVVWVS